MSRIDFLAVAFIFWKSSILATFALKLSENCIFEHNSKLLFEWVLETEISTRLKSTIFISQCSFRGGIAVVIWIINREAVATWRERTARWTFWSIISNYSFPAQSVGRPKKHKKWCCDSQVFFKPTRQIRLKKMKYNKYTILISAPWIFLQTQISGLKTIYVSDKEVRLRTKSAYQII